MKFVKSIAMVTLIMSATLSPYAINNSKAEQLPENLIFIGEDGHDKIAKEILESDSEALKAVKEFKSNGKLKIKTKDLDSHPRMDDFTTIAYPYKSVKNNKEIQEFLKEALINGKMVYLYGDKLTFEDYNKLLGVELKLNVPVKGNKEEKVAFKLGNGDDSKAEKIVDGSGSSLKLKKDQHVIGYSMDGNDEIQLSVSNISISDEKGNKMVPTIRHYMQSILESSASELTKKEENIALNLFSKNSTFALSGNQIVDSSDAVLKSEAYYTTTKAGSLETQWILYRNYDEQELDWDYFHIKHLDLITQYDTSWDAEDADVTHDLMYTGDTILESYPEDTPNSPYSVTFGWPWNLNFTFTLDTNADFNLTTNFTYNYSTWDLTDNELATGDSYEYYTGWKADSSEYTITKIAVDTSTVFYTGWDVTADADNSFVVDFDYN